MAAPDNRVPVRVARGTKATLDASITDLYEGEVVYATDEDSLYVLEGGALVLAGSPGGGSETLSGLTDTSITSPSTDEVLSWNGSAWVNAAASGGSETLSGLTDTSITSPSTDEVLSWNGSAWVNAAASGGSETLSGLTDTSISSPSTGEVLKYDAGGAVWQSGSLTTPDLGDVSYGTENVSRTWDTHAATSTVDANEWHFNGTTLYFNETAAEGTEALAFWGQLGNDLITISDSAGQTWTFITSNFTADTAGVGATYRFQTTIANRTGGEHIETLLDTTGPLTISYYGWGTNQALTEYSPDQLFQYDSTSSSFKAVSFDEANAKALALKQKPHLAHFDVAGNPPNVDDSLVPGAGRMYWTPNGNNILTSSNVEATQAKFGTNSLNVNGANGGYYIITGPVGEQWSFDCWVWPAATQTVGNFPRLLQNYHYVLALNLNTNIDRAYFQTYQGGSLAEELSSSDQVIIKDDWNHIALQKDGDLFTLWVNGVWQGRIVDPNAQKACSKWAIGNSVSEGNNLTGYLDEVRFLHGGAYIAQGRGFDDFTPPTSPYTSV